MLDFIRIKMQLSLQHVGFFFLGHIYKLNMLSVMSVRVALVADEVVLFV